MDSTGAKDAVQVRKEVPWWCWRGRWQPTQSPGAASRSTRQPADQSSDTAGTGCSVPATSSDAREAVAPDVPAHRGAVPLSGVDLVRPTALVVAGAGLVPVRGFMERGPHPEHGEHQDAGERD